MLSKHPLELPVGRKLTREEIVDAIRLSITAELDAINLYLQIARSIDDESIRKVFEDVAKEEKTHVGEFLALLKKLDAEQVSELARGEEEVAELTGTPLQPVQSQDASSQTRTEEDFVKHVAARFKDALNNSRVILARLPRVNVGRGVESVPYTTARGERSVVELREVQVKFRISQKTMDYYSRYGILEAPEVGFSARQLATSEDKHILETLLKCEQVKQLKMSTWEAPGQSVIDISTALAEMYKAGIKRPVVLILPSSRYVKLMNVSDRTGVMDLERVRALLDDIVVSDLLPADTALLVALRDDIVDVVVGGDGEVDYIGPEDGYHAFRAWSSLAVRIKDPSGIVVLKGE
ncbi:MAG: family 1 encapsulin nanocompartment shell protein [Desulfurococcaceae archaeon]